MRKRAKFVRISRSKMAAILAGGPCGIGETFTCGPSVNFEVHL